MLMGPGLRKLALTVHITASIGWIGSVAGFIALAVAVLTNDDVLTVRGALIAMGLTASWVILPMAFASLLTGLVMSLGTKWGLFRHYWVLISFILTVLAVIVLLTQMEPIGYYARVAADPTSSLADLRGGGSLLHPVGGLVVLLVIQVLNMYKPQGLTPYGWRKQQELLLQP